MNNTLLAYDGGLGYNDGIHVFEDFPASSAFPQTSLNLNTIFNTSAAVFSQWLASRGRYPTAQVGTPGVNPLLTNSPYGTQYGQPNQNLVGAERPPVNPNALGADDALSTIGGYITRNPIPVAAVVLGAFLLFREPPKRR